MLFCVGKWFEAEVLRCFLDEDRYGILSRFIYLQVPRTTCFFTQSSQGICSEGGTSLATLSQHSPSRHNSRNNIHLSASLRIPATMPYPTTTPCPPPANCNSISPA